MGLVGMGEASGIPPEKPTLQATKGCYDGGRTESR
jgi:hypothetical protein